MDPVKYFWSLAVTEIFAAVKCKSALKEKNCFIQGI